MDTAGGKIFGWLVCQWGDYDRWWPLGPHRALDPARDAPVQVLRVDEPIPYPGPWDPLPGSGVIVRKCLGWQKEGALKCAPCSAPGYRFR